MSHSHEAHDAHAHGGAAHAGPHHGPRHYMKIWAILCVLLIVSILGPELEIRVITLITAFGIAIVKAWMVASQFMHLNIEKKYVSMILVGMIGAILLFWFAVAPDVMKHEGTNWSNAAAHEYKAKAADGADGHGTEGGGGH